MFDYITDIIRASERTRPSAADLANAHQALQRAHHYTGPVYNVHGRAVARDAASPVRTIV